MRTRIIAALAALAGAAGLALQLRGSRRKGDARDERESLVDEVGRESFPASDPPSWTLGEERDE